MRSSIAARFSKAVSLFCAALLCCGLIPTTALAEQNSLSLIPEGGQGAAPIVSGAEGGDADAVSHYASDEPSSVDGDSAAFPSEDVIDIDEGAEDPAFINQDVELTTVVAQAESTKSFFLAQTLESTHTVPVVSAKLPLDTDDEASEPFASTVVGSFEYLGMTFAIEAGGESVALIAADYSKLPQEFIEKQVVIIPDTVTADGIDYYSVTRIADDAFSTFTKDNANPDYVGCEALFSDKELLVGTDIDQKEVAEGLNAKEEKVDIDGHDGVEVAGDSLVGCAGILVIYIPASVAIIEKTAFIGFETLQYIVVSESDANYTSYDGVLYNTGLIRLEFVPEGRVGSVCIAPEALEVDPEALSLCSMVDMLVVEDASVVNWTAVEPVSIPVVACTNLDAGFETDMVLDSLVHGLKGRIEEMIGSPSCELFSTDSSASSFAAFDFQGFDWGYTVIHTTGLRLMLLDPLSGGWVSSLDLTYGSSAKAYTTVRGYNGKSLSDPTTKITVEVFDSDVANSRSQLQIFWDRFASTYGTMTALRPYTAGSAGSPAYQNAVLGTYTISFPQFEFEISGADIVTTDLTSPSVLAGNTPYLFRFKPCYSPVSTVIDAFFDAKPGYIPGIGGGTFWRMSYNSIALPPSPNPPKGYTFKGWFTAPSGGSQVNAGGIEWIHWHYSAQFRPNTYKVALDGNGANSTVSPASIPATYDTDITLPTPTRPRYDFIGWNTAADGSGTSYSAGVITKPNITAVDGATVTLFAQWRARFYTVSWRDDEEVLDSQVLECGSTVTMADAIADKPAYAFVGWKASTNGSIYVAGSSSYVMTYQDVTFTAVWKLKPCTVVFDPGTDNADESSIIQPVPDPTSPFAIPAPVARGKGYAFSHWGITDDDETNLWYPGGQLTVEGILAGGYPEADVLESLPMGGTVYHNVITLHAVWIPTISVSTPLIVTMAIDPDTGEMIAGEGYISTTGTSEVSILSLAYDKTDSSSLGGGTDTVFGGDPSGISLTMASVRDDASDIESAFASASPFALDLGAQDGLPVTDSTLSAFPKFGNGVSLRIRYGLSFPTGFDISSLASSLPDKTDTEEGSTWSRESYPIANLHYTVGLVH